MESEDTVDRRRHVRLPVSVDLTVFSDRSGVVPGRVCDISESGFAAILPVELSAGEVVQVELYLDLGLRKEMAIVRHRSAFRHGFEFLAPSSAR